MLWHKQLATIGMAMLLCAALLLVLRHRPPEAPCLTAPAVPTGWHSFVAFLQTRPVVRFFWLICECRELHWQFEVKVASGGPPAVRTVWISPLQAGLWGRCQVQAWPDWHRPLASCSGHRLHAKSVPRANQVAAAGAGGGTTRWSTSQLDANFQTASFPGSELAEPIDFRLHSKTYLASQWVSKHSLRFWTPKSAL